MTNERIISGSYVNPGNGRFAAAVNSMVYVDKTDFLSLTNQVINSSERWMANSRPRRFGKSTTANMLTAYYSRGCDSAALFSKFNISRHPDFLKHLNQHNVISFDVQWFYVNSQHKEDVVHEIQAAVVAELKKLFPSVSLEGIDWLPLALTKLFQESQQRFVIIVDEWDALFRTSDVSPKTKDRYLEFLRGLFKGGVSQDFVELAFLTGILPPIKIETKSAFNDFYDYTMLGAGPLAPYFGFTEPEVKALCSEHHLSFSEVKHWYDGYLLDSHHIYNPRAVVELIRMRRFKSYWSQTGTYRTVKNLINMNFDGLKDAVIQMLAGAAIGLEPRIDWSECKSRDAVLTYLIHLGYLAYDADSRQVFIPNEEIREEFRLAVSEENAWKDIIRLQEESAKLVEATLHHDTHTVARILDRFHTDYASILRYNDENSLSCVLSIAYLGAMRWYYIPLREMPTGRGFADLIFVPKALYAASHPAMVIELKWNKDCQTALDQIKNKNYPAVLSDYTGEILLVGINYDRKAKVHECLIQKTAA